jgi:hypothetical protein
VILDLIEYEAHQLFWQVTVKIFTGGRGSEVRTRPSELVEFGSDDLGPFGIRAEALLGGAGISIPSS